MCMVNEGIVNKEDAYAVFGNIDAIRKLNEHFFTILYQGFEGYWNYKVIFADIKKQTYFFKIYFQYLKNFTISIAKIKHLKETNQRFVDFLAKIRQNQYYNNLTFEDYLIKPVQRLPKYVLLLKQLVKKTDSNHPDYENICKVLQSFQEVNSSNNEKMNKLINNLKLSEIQIQARLPFHVTEPGTQFILEQTVTILSSSEGKIIDCIFYLLNNRLILTKKQKCQQKYYSSVILKYGTSIMQNEEQETYTNCFTVQCPDGDSVTFLCQTQKEKIKLLSKIQQQLLLIEKKFYEKYSTLRKNNQLSQSFIRKISQQDLSPQVTIIGTQQRNDKIMKYTIYIIEVKLKNIRQKIFLRYSQLIDIQRIIEVDFPKIQIKQVLYKTTWLLNHKPKTIEERKINIQKFLKEILNKPEIIEGGQKILGKLGLSEDFYFMPLKFKDTESFVQKSVANRKSTVKYQRQTSTARETKSRKTYRLSIFQDLQEQQESAHKFSYNQSLKSSTTKKKFTIQELLFANEINLGHFVRYSQNLDYIQKKQIKVTIFFPWLTSSTGLVKKTIPILQSQRVSILISKIAKQINLQYHKDFRLFLQKQYSQRVLDDDQIILKIEAQLLQSNSRLIFKKMICIGRQQQQQQLRNDRLRLKLVASQVIYQVRMGKYKLEYRKFLQLATLIGIIKFEGKESAENGSVRDTFSVRDIKNSQEQPKFGELAMRCRELLKNQYASFCQNNKVWVKDFTELYKKIHAKLMKIASENTKFVRTSSMFNSEQQKAWTSLIQLSYISIIDCIKNNKLFGSIAYIVQISQEFRNQLILKFKKQHKRSFDEQTLENRNVWMVIKCDEMYLYSINFMHKLHEIKYQDVQKVVCYPSSIVLSFERNDISTLFQQNDKQNEQISDIFQQCLNQPSKLSSLSSFLKFKTTSSFYIRQILNYYKHYSEMSKKIKTDAIYSQSIFEMIEEHQKMTHSSIFAGSVIVEEYIQEDLQ